MPALSIRQRLRHITPNVDRKKAVNKLSRFALHDDGYAPPFPQVSSSPDEKANRVKPEIARFTRNINDMESEVEATKSGIVLLNSNVTTQLKSCIEIASAQISVFNANMNSRQDKFENRFLFRMLFPVSGLLCVFYCFLVIVMVFSIAVLEVRGRGGEDCRCFKPTIPDSYLPESYLLESYLPNSCLPNSYDPGSHGRTEVKQEG